MFFFSRFFIAIIVTELARKTGRLFFSVKMVNIFEIRPFLTLKGLTQGTKILARKSSNMALDRPRNLLR